MGGDKIPSTLKDNIMFPGPTPPYSNPPIQPQNYKPGRFEIVYVDLGTSTGIVTKLPMNYVVGQLVRLHIPKGYGCVQLDGLQAYVEEIIGENKFLIDINSSLPFFNEYIEFNGRTPPEVVAIGDINSGGDPTINRNKFPTTVKGAFINIS